MSHSVEPDPIRLEVPADERHLRLLRVSAVAAGADVLGAYERLDDLRLAIDELAIAMIRAAPEGARLRVAMTPDADSLTVVGRIEANGEAPRLSEVGELLLRSVCRSYRLDRDGDDLRFELVVAGPAG